MEEKQFIQNIDSELKRVTTLLAFLIIQPSLLDTMMDSQRERIMVENLIRVKCCKFWAENMIKEVESKCAKKSLKAVNELFKLIEVKRK